MTADTDNPRPPARGRARLWRRVYLLLALFFWVYVLFGAEGLLRQYERYRRADALQHTLNAEKAENERLRHEIQALRSDDLTIEAAIRTELDYQREGETVIIFEDEDPLTAPLPSVDSPGGDS
ncbi:MAG: septum formation initiator family protein [Acidobacteriota bacterium]|nr:MAG: septum formation initiator family protein [Acidobacteriota bacterium]